MKVASVVACAAICVGFAGCGGDDDDGVSSAGSALSYGSLAEHAAPDAAAPDDSPDVSLDVPFDVSSTPPDSTVAPVYVDVDVDPGLADDGFVGARDDVELHRCERDGDRWVAAGMVTNASGKGAGYRIYVAFNPPHSTAARGLVQVDLLIPDGERQTWKAVAWITDPDLECILRVERVSG